MQVYKIGVLWKKVLTKRYKNIVYCVHIEIENAVRCTRKEQWSRNEFCWLLFKVWNGGLAIYGGIIGAIISTVIYCKVKKLNIAKVFDVCAPGLFIGQAIGRFGNFVNVEVYGGETNSLFGMSINGATPVHPLFLYESIWNVIGLVILLLIRDKKKNDGQVFCFYIFWYSFGRLFLEGMRNPNYILYVIPNVLGISQLVAILFMIAAVSAFVVLQVKAKKDNEI